MSVDNKQLEYQPASEYQAGLESVLQMTPRRQESQRRINHCLSRAQPGLPPPLHLESPLLVFSAAEYCAQGWSRSPHVKKADPVINNALQTITGCVKQIPVLYLPARAGNAPVGLRRETVTLTLTRKAQQHDWHILHPTTRQVLPTSRLKTH